MNVYANRVTYSLHALFMTRVCEREERGRRRDGEQGRREKDGGEGKEIESERGRYRRDGVKEREIKKSGVKVVKQKRERKKRNAERLKKNRARKIDR